MRRRRPAAPSSEQVAVTYKAASLLLLYPDDELEELSDQLSSAIASLPADDARAALEQFLAWQRETPLLDRQRHYVQQFDLKKRSGLYLTFYGEGDKRERGPALLRLKQLYRSGGLPLEGTELPDFLPVMLEFAASAPAGQGEIVLREHRAALELLRLSLTDDESPYGLVVEAVCVALGEATAAERLEAGKLAMSGPPSEQVGLEPFAPPEIMPTTGARR